MITLSAGLQTAVAGAATKKAWAAALNTALGATKRVRCFQTISAVTTEFRNVGLTNVFTATNAGLALTGKVADTTVQLAADLSQGTSVLRIEGNGHTIEGTLGTAGTDFIASGNFGTNTGFGISSSLLIVPPAILPDAIFGPADVVVEFGAPGSLQTVTTAEQIYDAMSIGFGTVTQSRWRCNTITVGGIDYTIFLGIDSDQRVDVWINAAWAAAANTSDTARNREYANVSLKVAIEGVQQNLFGQGTTFTYNHQRATWLRWQSSEMPWSTTNSFISQKITDGVFLKHDSRSVPGSLENTSTTNLPSVTGYVPFTTFCDFDQSTKVGDQSRSSPAGGERTSIGPVHEWFARLISEIGTNNNASWLTATRLRVLRDLAETAAQFPICSGLLNPSDKRLLDPSLGYCSHDNPNAWAPNTGIPQPGTTGTGGDAYFNGRYDAAHPYNKFSFHAYHLSKDPWHLFQTQAQAIGVLAFNTSFGGERGADGKTLRVTVQEERGFWWSLHCLLHAWHATPSGTMPKPFRDKSYFENAINNSLQWIRDKYISAADPYYSGIQGEALRFWRMVSVGVSNSFVTGSAFMSDYGHIVCCAGLLLGFTPLRDVAEWKAVNAKLRAEMGGNWYLNDADMLASFGLLLTKYAADTDSSLPYATSAAFKTWYPSATAFTSGSLTTSKWAMDGGRDTYLWWGALNLYKEVSNRGLITLTFNPATERSNSITAHPGPYTSESSGLPLNYPVWAKQYFSY
jgi:hypothetical protein